MRREPMPSGPQLAQGATGRETEGAVVHEGHSAVVAVQRASAGPAKPSLAHEEDVRAPTTPDLGSAFRLARPRHVGRLSLAQLEALAVDLEQVAAARVSKTGIAVVKRKASPGHQTPRLMVITEAAWCRLTGTPEPEPRPAETLARGGVGTQEAFRLPVGRPSSGVVKEETVRVLRQANETVSVPMLVGALRHETGCSRAGAYPCHPRCPCGRHDRMAMRGDLVTARVFEERPGSENGRETGSKAPRSDYRLTFRGGLWHERSQE